ncbi:SDR family NAD(P)-dependent oxidoreductase, partial [Neobacillus vireti]|uniref:SDR family NAD(P)-dependent oxidoreductase n=1 Tax=Neobacillus vireti TaxID=220686 RepID=UPI003000D5F2
MTNLNGKVAIVTGGSRGIGAAISMELARQGVKVVLNFVSREELAEKMVADINEIGGEAYAVRADVSNT